MKRIDKGDPNEITDGKHVSESVGGNVHSGQDRSLVVQCIGDVPALEEEDEPHRVCDVDKRVGEGVLDGATGELGEEGGDVGESWSAADGLFACHRDVDEDPEDHAWSQFVERLDVKGADLGVQFTAHEPIVEVVARVSTESKELAVVEAYSIHVNCLNNRVYKGTSEDSGPVGVDKSKGSGSTAVDETGNKAHREEERGKCVDLVLQLLPGTRRKTFNPVSGDDKPRDDGESIPSPVDLEASWVPLSLPPVNVRDGLYKRGR